MQSRSSRTALTASMFAMIVLIAGCSGPSGVDEGGTTVTDPGAKSTATVAASQGIASLDPAKLVFAWEQTPYTIVYDALTSFHPDHGEEIQPALAKSWEASQDLLTYTFELREGVKFSNGEELTAQDVVQNIERYLDPENAFYGKNRIDAIESVEASGDTTVIMRLSRPSASLPTSLQIAPIVYLRDRSEEQLSNDPIGTGPYLLESFVPNGRVEFTRNEEYWGGPPPTETLIIDRASDNTSALSSLKQGELSALFNIPWPDVEGLESEGGAVVSQESPAGKKFLDIDNTSEPFNDPNARLALSYAIDRETIIDSIFLGNGVIPPTNAPITPDSMFASEALPAVEFDLDEAKRLFELAGVEEGHTLTYWTPGAGAYPELTSIGLILRDDLQEIGINLEIESAELSSWAERFFPAGKSYPNLIVGNSSNGPGGIGALTFFTSGRCECNYSDPEFDEALREADATEDGDFDVAMEILTNANPIITIAMVPAPIGIGEGVGGVWLDASGSPRFEDISVG